LHDRRLSNKVRRRVRIALLILALTVTQALAIEILPSEKMCVAVFKGEVLSVEMVQTLTNYTDSAELYAARIKVTSVTKQDTKLGREVTVYYVYDRWQLCPRCVDLTAKQKATFYCNRTDIGGRTKVLFVPMATFVENQK
jgi:hypothetical protein